MILSQRTLSILTLLNSGVLVVILLILVTSGVPGETENKDVALQVPADTKPPEVGVQKKYPVHPSQTEGTNSTDVVTASNEQREEGARGFGELLEQTIEPLRRASTDHNEAIDLPTKEEIAAAEATGSISSPETVAVLTKLKEGYK